MSDGVSFYLKPLNDPIIVVSPSWAHEYAMNEMPHFTSVQVGLRKHGVSDGRKRKQKMVFSPLTIRLATVATFLLAFSLLFAVPGVLFNIMVVNIAATSCLVLGSVLWAFIIVKESSNSAENNTSYH
jgi:hypothetical protein